MSLLDQLRDAQTEPARHRTSPFAGPSILTLAQLRAMERVLLREMPGYGSDTTTVVLHEHHEHHEPQVPQVPQVPQPPHPARARAPHVELEPLALWSPPASVAVARPSVPVEPPAVEPAPAEPLPVWSAPDEPAPSPSAPPASPGARRTPDPCPQCGEAVSIGRIDLTANASWFSCRSCGLRWGGAIESSVGERDEATAG